MYYTSTEGLLSSISLPAKMIANTKAVRSKLEKGRQLRLLRSQIRIPFLNCRYT